jgi:hypothetical protein
LWLLFFFFGRETPVDRKWPKHAPVHIESLEAYQENPIFSPENGSDVAHDLFFLVCFGSPPTNLDL